MSTRTARAAELTAEIRAALDAANLRGVHVTVNPAEVVKAMPAGVVVITPPDLTFTTFTITDSAWELWVIAGPSHDPLTAWDRLDAIIDALAEPLGLTAARSDAYQPLGDRPPFPAYVLTLTETHTH